MRGKNLRASCLHNYVHIILQRNSHVILRRNWNFISWYTWQFEKEI